MKKPEELTELLADLRNEVKHPSARYEAGARIVVFIGKGQLNLAAPEAVFLLHSPDTVNRFFEAIGSPDDAGVELYSFDIEDDVKSALDTQFSTVDEL
jgi:hypothetical protein